MRKAYDRLEWVRMVMRLVTTVSFQVLFNGGKLRQFTPSRGVRQEDPISPYLFLMAVSLSSELHGLKVASSAPAVSHLLFADDILLLFKADTEIAVNV
jgi:hypothetical protein